MLFTHPERKERHHHAVDFLFMFLSAIISTNIDENFK
jgi:hypothetical protein